MLLKQDWWINEPVTFIIVKIPEIQNVNKYIDPLIILKK